MDDKQVELPLYFLYLLDLYKMCLSWTTKKAEVWGQGEKEKYWKWHVLIPAHTGCYCLLLIFFHL